ncbi:hypothetical protein L7F22_066194 [Adiantum nelumboides]|nr:hypothetical protein [Adiantum nelumboides]
MAGLFSARDSPLRSAVKPPPVCCLAIGGDVGGDGFCNCEQAQFGCFVIANTLPTEGDAFHACKLLHAAGPSKVIITSLEVNGSLLLIGSNLRSKDEAPEQFRITMSKIPEYFTGTGDLMTALILGWSHKYPNDLEKATELAVSSLQSVLKRTVADYLAAKIRPCVKQLELRLIQCQDEIKFPKVTHSAQRYP